MEVTRIKTENGMDNPLVSKNSNFSFVIFLSFVFVLFGCKGESFDVSKLVAERDSILAENNRQKQELEDLNSFVGVVSNGLDSIAVQEGFLRNMGPEGNGMTREQMKQSLSELADMLARQRARITQLEDSLNVKGSGAGNLRNIIAFLNEQLEAKEKLITQLRAEVNNKNSDIKKLQSRVNSLNEDVQTLDKKNQMQKKALENINNIINECYVKIGTKKQLKQAGIIEGGLLKKTKLISASLTPKNFSTVDIRQFTEVSLHSKNPKILTTMPQSSYTIVRKGDGSSVLLINNPTEFWSISNYLVIALD